MGFEIERKFLVRDDSWRRHPGTTRLLVQWYLSTDPKRTIRVRRDSGGYILCVKGETTGMTRKEVEAPIPIAEDVASELMGLRAEGTYLVRKTRTKIIIGDLTWEVDEFHDENKGLVVAEVELEHEDQQIVLPFWIGEEVTYDHRYSNSTLSKKPYQLWTTK